MEKEIFEKEIALCKKLNKENNGKCNWGECEKCGVIPMLHKLYKGEVIEDKNEILKLKNDILGKP